MHDGLNKIRDNISDYIAYLSPSIANEELPAAFPDPFDPVPHPVAVMAARHLQDRISGSMDLRHSFGLDDDVTPALGKMFGVLAVRDTEGTIGYLSAFSGKLQSGTQISGFVPPVFDTLDPGGFYLQGEEEINTVSRRISVLESDPGYKALLDRRTRLESDAAQDLHHARSIHDEAKRQRAEKRQASQHLSEAERNAILQSLEKESMRHHYLLKDRRKHWQKVLEELNLSIQEAEKEIIELKEKRKEMSAVLQSRLFEHYNFLNASGHRKNLAEIFHISESQLPPSGAGECTAPKLLHFAYTYGLAPVALAEFWWGVSPSSEIRRHGQYYPACHTKCRPILHHMLSGLSLPASEGPAMTVPTLRVLLEDDHILVIDKPAGTLAVPGKGRETSIAQIIREKYPEATGPLIVHRLDMSTSGIMLIAKNIETYHHLQGQFIRRTIKKRYTAILEGTITPTEGTIELPLRPDIDDRPRQMVCYSHGKQAVTGYKVVSTEAGQTRIHFLPLTGRTHQLRVHAAHKDGLNTPILGDDLYGTKADRLHLHADRLEFEHPVSHEKVVVVCDAGF